MADSHSTPSSDVADEALAWLSGIEADVAALTSEQRAEIKRRAERFAREVAEVEAGRHPLQRDLAVE